MVHQNVTVEPSLLYFAYGPPGIFHGPQLMSTNSESLQHQAASGNFIPSIFAVLFLVAQEQWESWKAF